MLSPGLVEMYYGKTDKTLTRDINALLELELIRRQGGGYVPNKQIIEAFRPLTAELRESA